MCGQVNCRRVYAQRAAPVLVFGDVKVAAQEGVQV
jgi:hypothetical protein